MFSTRYVCGIHVVDNEMKWSIFMRHPVLSCNKCWRLCTIVCGCVRRMTNLTAGRVVKVDTVICCDGARRLAISRWRRRAAE